MLETEQSVLGGLMLDASRWDEVSAIVKADDFSQRYRPVYLAMMALAGELTPLDPLTLGDFLRDRGELETVGGMSELTHLVADTASAVNLEAWASLLADNARADRARASMADLLNRSQTDASAREELCALAGELPTSGRLMDMGAVTARLKETADEHRDNPQPPYHFGLGWLDERIPCRPGRVIVVAARPGVGKTALLTQGAWMSAKAGNPGVCIHLEMMAEDMGRVIYAQALELNNGLVLRGDSAVWRHIYAAEFDLSALPLYMTETAFDPASITAEIRKAVKHHGCRFAIVDHLHLVQLAGVSRVDELTDLMKALKYEAKRLRIPIIVAAQLNRDSVRSGREPEMHDLRASGGIEENADAVVFLHAKGERGRIVKIEKNRMGKKGRNPEIIFDGETQQFTDPKSELPGWVQAARA